MSGAAFGSLVAAAGLAPLLVSTRPRVRGAGLAAWTAGVVILAADLLHSPISTLRVEASDRPALAALALVAALIGIAAGGALAHRYPMLVLLAAIAAAPARIPVSAGGEDANLLLPLYVVIAAAWAATAYELVRGIEPPPRLGGIGHAAALIIGWAAVTTIWTADERQGSIMLLFFLLPFGLLLMRLGSLAPALRDLRAGLGIQVVLGLTFAVVAFYQFIARDVFWNAKIIVANEYAAFFRVNSLFYDASVFGRFMAVTIVLLAGVAVCLRLTPALGALIAVFFVGLYVSYSQSSLLALAAGSLVLGLAVWPRRLLAAVAGAGALVGVAVLVAAFSGGSADSVSSDRSRLVDLGAEVISEHPIGGAGSGGFARAALRDTAHPGRVASAASHTTPVTVLAEWGPVGFAAYVWLLVAASRAALANLRQPLPHIVLLAALAAIFASSLFYNAFFEDPAVWILLALIATVTPLIHTRPEAPA